MGIVAILDDGINSAEIKRRVRSYKVFQNKIVKDIYIPEMLSHGTICAKIIEKRGKVDFFYSIRILDEHGIGNIESLCLALEWLADKKVDFINISNGIVDYIERNQEYMRLWRICKVLVTSNKKIIAARSNLEIPTIPADFSFVVGVSSFFKKYSKANILAIGSAKILLKDMKIKETTCNSYACAFATAVLSNSNEVRDLKFCGQLGIRCNRRRTIYKQLLHTKKKCVPTVPIVTFIGNLKACVRVRCYLVPEFQRRGYRVSSVSDIKDSYLYNINFIPVLTRKKIGAIQNLEFPDIILTFERSRNSDSDVNIEIISEDRYKINSGEYCYRCSKNNLSEYIIKILS